MTQARGIAIGLFVGALAACSPQEPPAGAAAPAPQSAPRSAPGSAVPSAFIPTQAELAQFHAEGPDPTLRKIAMADYWLHYKLMQATGIEKELGGEAQAIEALKALGDAYERRVRMANEELPRFMPASFTGEGMNSGYMGMTLGTAIGLVTGGMAAGGVSGMSDNELKDLSSHGPIKQRSDGGSSEITFGEDGSLSQSMEFAVDKDGVNGKVKLKTHMDACPDADGRVTVEIDVDSQMSVSGKPGTGGHMKSHFKYEGFLDEDAQLIASDGSAANMRINMGGYENFESQSMDITAGYERGGKGILELNEQTGFSIFRQDETERTLKMMQETLQLQIIMAEALLSGGGSGKPAWESGRCINLQVTSSPTKRTGVKPSAHFDLEAKPRAKDDGSPAPGTVTATLTGSSSLQPSSGKVKADAKYAYVGPEEKEKAASIAFESRSKRGVGRATLEFDTKTARAYRINGTTAGASFTGEACSLDQPFTVNVDAITGKWPMEFSPRDGLSGQMKGSYSGDGCTLSGGGPYSVKLGDDGSGTLTFTYTSTARCQVGVQTTTVTTQLNLVPADDLKCN